MTESSSQEDRALFKRHSRSWRENLYVYPVVSRRSHGVSIGVNLNPNMVCSFDCVYCQVDRTVVPKVRTVDPAILRNELDELLTLAQEGVLFDAPEFGHVPEGFRRINDIAFSGDGEPTASTQFPEAVRIAAELKAAHGLNDVKIVLITNAAHLHRKLVRDALSELDANNGEIWAKLDAGTEDYYRTVNRSDVPMKQVLDNIRDAACVRPIVIQSLWMRVYGELPSDAEVDAFGERLAGVVEAGGAVKLVQVYTIARQPAESWVEPLANDELTRLGDRIRAATKLPTELFGG